MTHSVESIKTFLDSYKREEIQDNSLTPAAVLMLLFEKNRDLFFLLTKRTEEVEHHKGQISFPGGATDKRDKDIVATALRETEEEVGMRTDSVMILGLADDIWTPTGFRVTPVVGYVPSLLPLKLNKSEVEETLQVPLSFFLDERNERIGHREVKGRRVTIYYYTFGEFEIWGATAAIIHAFLKKLSDSQ